MLGGKLGAEILRFKDLANLNIRLLAWHGIRTALDPINRLLQRFALPKPESGDQFLCLGEWAVDHGPLLSQESDPRSLRAGLKSLTRQHHPGFCQFFIKLAHLGEQFWRRLS